VAGKIREEDVSTVRERARIDEIVREIVTLKAAGGGSYKGLCPFHDERTPSFHVTPSKGLYHCFSCGEGGDVITFVRKIDALSFTEAVEKLAGKYGITLRYEEGSGTSTSNQGQRARLVEAHKVAANFYRAQLQTPAAQHARTFLTERGFDPASWELFGVGYSPAGWDALRNELRSKGFTEDEMLTSGLAVSGQRGAYDRFRDRVMWPIRDSSGDTIGFGARKLSESDQGPKYLNTPETPIYRKSQVLYGIDLARREMAKAQQAVVVEGYTDVMACHLAGITTAVATCGTAFGPEHVKVLRRILMDDDTKHAEVIYTFDGDAAGRKAALKAFGEDQKFVAATFVAIEPHGLDPCDLRLAHGDEGLKNLIANKIPLFEFVLKSTVDDFDLETAEGRVAGLRAAAPILAGIKDAVLRAEYIRTVSGWLGMDESSLRKEVTSGNRNAPVEPTRAQTAASSQAANVEREVLKCVLQTPHLVGTWFESLEESVFTVPAAAQVFMACVAAGNPLEFVSAQAWIAAVLEKAPDDEIRSHVRAMAVAPLPNDNPDERYVQAVLARILEMDAARRVNEIKSGLSRAEDSGDADEQSQLLAELLGLEKYRRDMRTFAVGDS